MIQTINITSNIDRIDGEIILYDGLDVSYGNCKIINLERVLVILSRTKLNGEYLPTNNSRYIDDDTIYAHFEIPRYMKKSDVYIGTKEMRSIDVWANTDVLLKNVIVVWCKCSSFNINCTIPVHSVKMRGASSRDISAENDVRCYRAMMCELVNSNYCRFGTNLNLLTYNITTDRHKCINVQNSKSINKAYAESIIANNVRYAVKTAYTNHADTAIDTDPIKVDKYNSALSGKICEIFFLHRANIRSMKGMIPDSFGPYDPELDEDCLMEVFKCKYVRSSVIYSLQQSLESMSWRSSNTTDKVKIDFVKILGDNLGNLLWNNRTDKSTSLNVTDLELFVKSVPSYLIHEIIMLFHPDIEPKLNNRGDTFNSYESKLEYKDSRIMRTERFKSLCNYSLNIRVTDVMEMYMRYQSLGDTGQQTHTPTMVAKMLKYEFGVKYEGYASPINAQHDKYCSLMYDLDSKFGSMGPFSSQVMINNQDGNWSINPPFTEYYYIHMKNEIVKAFEQGIREDMLVFIKVPNWIDCKGIDWLKSKDNKYMIDHRVLSVGEFSFERVNGDKLYKLSGGLLMVVLSPLGSKHPTFGKIEMDRFVKVMNDTVPVPLRGDNMYQGREYVNGTMLRKKIKEGERDFSKYDLSNGITMESIEKYIKKIDNGSNSGTNSSDKDDNSSRYSQSDDDVKV